MKGQKEKYISINGEPPVKIYTAYAIDRNPRGGNKCAYCGKDLNNQYVAICEVHFLTLDSWVHCVPFCRDCRDNAIHNPSPEFILKMFEVKRTVDRLQRKVKKELSQNA